MLFIFLILKKDATCLHFIQFVFCSQYRDCFRYLHTEHVVTEHKGELWNKYLSLNVERMREKQTDITFLIQKMYVYYTAASATSPNRLGSAAELRTSDRVNNE